MFLQAVGETFNKLDCSTSKKLEKYDGNRLEDSIKKYLLKSPEHLSNQRDFFQSPVATGRPNFVCGAELGGAQESSILFPNKNRGFLLDFSGSLTSS